MQNKRHKSLKPASFTFLSICMLWIFGCSPSPDLQIQQPQIRKTQPSIRTMAIDARDYNDVANAIYQSLVRSEKIEEGAVTAIGPVEIDTCFEFDKKRLQEKIQVAARLNFTFITDALQGNSAAKERYKIMRLQWMKENKVKDQLLKTVGELADIDYILFGRLSTITQSTEYRKEVTYTYNWKLGDCQSGLIVWMDEVEFTKSAAR